AVPSGLWAIEWLAALSAGTVAGALVGALAGARLRQVLPTMAKLTAGTFVGLIFGTAYFSLWAPLVEDRVAAEWGLVLQLLLGPLAGLAGGAIVGLLVDYIPKRQDDADTDPVGIADVPVQRGRPFHFS